MASSSAAASDSHAKGAIPFESNLGRRLLRARDACISSGTAFYQFPEVSDANGQSFDLLDFQLAGRQLYVCAPHATHPHRFPDGVTCPCGKAKLECSGYVKYFRRWQDMDRTHFLLAYEYRHRDCQGEEALGRTLPAAGCFRMASQGWAGLQAPSHVGWCP